MSIKDKIFHLYFLVLLLSFSTSLASGNTIRCLDSERRALLELRNELVDEYGRLSSWGTGENKRECCEWRGVYCHNRTNHVARLSLRGPSQSDGYAPLQGAISPSLLELKRLTYLDLSLNDFESSSIPEFIGSLDELRYLNLSNANFGGTVPQSFGNLSKLVYLDLGYNFLFSESLGWLIHLRLLESLDLSRVFLVDETTNWLREISGLSSIKELHWRYADLKDLLPSSLPTANASNPLAILDLSRNHLSFSTLHWFLHFNGSLTFIDFSVNNLSGPILSAFESLRSLEHLDLSRNALEGGIPKFLGNMSSLLYLNLQRTHLTAQLSELMMNLTGSLEKNLQYLDLSYNSINGSLIDFSRFSSLTQLALRSNRLNGFIEKGYLNLPLLIALDMSSNNFTGAIADLTTSPYLEVLFLNNNMFNGPLAESIGRLAQLKVLCLGSNQLQGVVTEAHLSNLSRLQLLELSSNSQLTLNCSPDWVPAFQLVAASLSGCNIGPRFPEWLRFQTKLMFLDISFNQITDSIPTWLGDLASKLVYLNVSSNQIYGLFPNITFSTATINSDSYALVPDTEGGSVLDLSRNRIIGPVYFLCLTSTWRLLDLSNNRFFGQLPECFANYSSLQFLSLANNGFTGKIPESFGLLSSLSWLNLRNNTFSGRIPSSMRNCQSLEVIDLGDNRLTGEIPAWIGTQFSISLLVLSLRSNAFYGDIPSSICSLERIQVLALSSNNISGVIPNCIHFLKAMAKRPTPFTLLYLTEMARQNPGEDAFSAYRGLLDGVYFLWKGQEVEFVNGLTLVSLIDLSDNDLGGIIPSEITELTGLIGLNLARNNLTGYIPQHIGHLRSLDILDLSGNHLSGGIPPGIGNLSLLGFLNLSYNNLSGRIPPGLNFDESSYIGNSLLCGRPILGTSCPGDRETHRHPSFIDDGKKGSVSQEHEEDSFISRGFYISLGLGGSTISWLNEYLSNQQNSMQLPLTPSEKDCDHSITRSCHSGTNSTRAQRKESRKTKLKPYSPVARPAPVCRKWRSMADVPRAILAEHLGISRCDEFSQYSLASRGMISTQKSYIPSYRYSGVSPEKLPTSSNPYSCLQITKGTTRRLSSFLEDRHPDLPISRRNHLM
ncbi:receptor-like protein 12 [Dorcoceras hygrometricum]|uniref:Receptor-like protein 12 n=1 Tax=Dorcoceras hygrometricum TaxID=472368 RepID=A0A2Z7AZS6_9LAMI|nr:receptor-like protein 12 [Dorcoceras hygrometricum]